MFRLCVGEKKGIALESTNWFKCASSFTKKTCAKCSQGHCLLLSYSLLFTADWIILWPRNSSDSRFSHVPFSPQSHRSPSLSGWSLPVDLHTHNALPREWLWSSRTNAAVMTGCWCLSCHRCRTGRRRWRKLECQGAFYRSVGAWAFLPIRRE